MNAYIAFLRKDDAVHLDPSFPSSNLQPESVKPPDDAATEPDPQDGLNESGIALVCISGGGELELIRTWCDAVVNVGSLL